MRTIVRSTIAMVAATAVVAIAFTVSDADARRGGGSGGVRAAGVGGGVRTANVGGARVGDRGFRTAGRDFGRPGRPVAGNSNNWNGRYLGWGAAGLGAAALAGSYYYNNYDNSSYNNCSAPYYGGSSYSGCDYSSYAYSPSYGDGYDYASSGSGYNPYFRRTFWGGSRRFGW